MGLWLISDFFPTLHEVVIKEYIARQKRMFAGVSDKYYLHVTVLNLQ